MNKPILGFSKTKGDCFEFNDIKTLMQISIY